MYQQYRPQKSRSSRGAKGFAIVFAIIVLGLGLWYLPKLGKKVETIETQQPVTKPTRITDAWFVGKKVALSGNISSVNTTSYTHILSMLGEEIHLFSSTRDLSSSNGFVFIQGEVAKYDGNAFIVDVEAIGSSLEQLQTMSLPTSTSGAILPNIALKIDLGGRSDISYSLSGNIIILQADGFSGNTIVEGFRCETGFPSKDCDIVAKNFTNGSFVSAGGMTYMQGSGGTWFAKNSAGVGYRVTTASDAMLYKISSILIPLNDTYVKGLLSNAQKLCSTISSLTKTDIQKDSLSVWRIILTGKGQSGADAQCVVQITFTEKGEELTLSKQTGVTNTTVKTGSTVTTTTDALPANTSSTAPAVSASGLVYTSTRGGYTIIYPSAKITYNGINIQENLGIDKLSCYIRIDIKDYKDKDDDAIGPAVAIYECTSKESSDALASKATGYIFKTNKDGTKLFFIKVLNPAWADFAAGIKIQ